MSQSQSWAEMMVAAQKGNSTMYNTLLTEVSQYLMSYLSFKLNSASDAQDLVQEILISIHRSRHTFDSAYPFKPWLFTITQSRLIEFWRRDGRRLEKNNFIEEAHADVLVAEAEISFVEIQYLQNALSKLPEQQRHIMTGLKLDSKSIKDLASEHSMSEAAVKVAAHRAYKTLAKELEIDL